ncbi:MAG TPA: glycosyltransferase [Acidimicrobiia bacterium]|nr:glycosyltransferase [Acidimicrobiia bacterium]
MGEHQTSVVVATRDRRDSLRATLARLTARDSRPVVVVDNGSDDGTPAMVRRDFPQVCLVPLGRNRGAAARNIGVAVASTELVAFADDDSWWDTGALATAEKLFGASPDLGLLAARILVGPDRRLDPTCAEMAAGPLGLDRHGHRRILGFVACGAVVRREAFREVGGFEELLFFLGEEETLALDLAAAGWDLIYAPEVVALHHPGSVERRREARHRLQTRNRLLSSMMHQPWPAVTRQLTDLAGEAITDRHARAALGQALVRFPGAISRRRPLPPGVEKARRAVEEGSELTNGRLGGPPRGKSVLEPDGGEKR